ncbi:Uncharacterized protein YP598_3056 [Yersinia pseudotuberculosis]|uniref:Uncharacterized protein n=1 Tax=Yersinia pseudotuberculosis serotype O:1b (strain IP 31758) TaxID=349747 RepID=A0A0U1R238_YERP3|nr:hypothetical protein YpsIP31758_2991 [Yersinia pseudotuberculosis IP 31758]UFA62670.1 Uncharacterized protein YP598_3056 [Yersinia pseudotuberculosis]
MHLSFILNAFTVYIERVHYLLLFIIYHYSSFIKKPEMTRHLAAVRAYRQQDGI